MNTDEILALETSFPMFVVQKCHLVVVITLMFIIEVCNYLVTMMALSKGTKRNTIVIIHDYIQSINPNILKTLLDTKSNERLIDLPLLTAAKRSNFSE